LSVDFDFFLETVPDAFYFDALFFPLDSTIMST